MKKLLRLPAAESQLKLPASGGRKVASLSWLSREPQRSRVATGEGAADGHGLQECTQPCVRQASRSPVVPEQQVWELTSCLGAWGWGCCCWPQAELLACCPALQASAAVCFSQWLLTQRPGPLPGRKQLRRLTAPPCLTPCLQRNRKTNCQSQPRRLVHCEEAVRVDALLLAQSLCAQAWINYLGIPTAFYGRTGREAQQQRVCRLGCSDRQASKQGRACQREVETSPCSRGTEADKMEEVEEGQQASRNAPQTLGPKLPT